MGRHKSISLGPKSLMIPFDWEDAFFEDVVRINPRYRIPDQNEFPFVPMDALSETTGAISYWTTRTREDCTNTRFKLHDILFAKITPSLENGKVVYVGEVPSNSELAFGSTELLVFHPDKGRLNPLFLYYMVKSRLFRDIAASLMQGSTNRQRVPLDIFHRFLRIPVPPLPEQNHIAEILSTVDEAIRKTDEVIEKAERLKRGLMQDLLTKGTGHMEFKEVQIGPRKISIPVVWDVKTLGGRNGLCKIVTGGTPSTTVENFWNGHIEWVIPSDITRNKGVFIHSSRRKITEEGLRASSARVVPSGSILLTTRATIGAACINTVPMATNQGFKSLVCRNGVSNLFVYYMLQREKKRLESLGGGSTFVEVSMRDVSGFEIPTPAYDEQVRIAEILLTLDQMIEIEKGYRNVLGMLTRGLMQDLLIGKVRVQSGRN